jgi:hypothetical protein
VQCNGQPLKAAPGDWWLDKSFGRLDLAGAARVGINAITIRAAPFTMYHELEPAYLLGEFALLPGASGFIIAPDRPLELGPWNAQGHPFYASGVSYRERFQIPAPAVRNRYVVALTDWYGSVAKVLVNGQLAGYIGYPPWQCDVTKQLKAGVNEIDLVVVGTLKNTLGPHHGKPGLGTAWPGMFQKGPNPGPPPGNEYDTVGYGLFAPFALQESSSSDSSLKLKP